MKELSNIDWMTESRCLLETDTNFIVTHSRAVFVKEVMETGGAVIARIKSV